MLKNQITSQPTLATTAEAKETTAHPNIPGLLISTESIDNLLQTGVEKAQQNKPAEAIACFKQVIERDPCHEIALLWLGHLSTTPLQALDYYSRVIRLNPHNEVARQQFKQAFIDAQEMQIVKKPMIENTVEIPVKTLPRRVASRIPWIGEVLLERGFVNREQLEVALDRQQELAYRKRWKPLGEILIQLNYIKRYQLEDALQYQHEHNSF